MTGRSRGQIWRYAPEYRRPRHFHAEPELNLVTAGEATFGVGENEISVAAGDLLFWMPGQDHVLLGASSDFDLFIVGVTPALSARVLGVAPMVPCRRAHRVRLAPGALDRMRSLCAAAPSPEDTAAIEHRVGDLWRAADAARASPPTMHTLTRRALASLVEQPALRRSDVARLVRAAPTEVSRHFHRNVGLTLTAFRTRLRLLRFIDIADGGVKSLLSAALDAGFGSYSQCHRAFQTTFGCAPRAFFGTAARRRMGERFEPARWYPMTPP